MQRAFTLLETVAMIAVLLIFILVCAGQIRNALKEEPGTPTSFQGAPAVAELLCS